MQIMKQVQSYADRMRASLFGSPASSLATILISSVLVLLFWKGYEWAVVQAVFSPDPQACQQASGACWGFVQEKWRLIVFGRYPYDLQWRPAAAMALLAAGVAVAMIPAMWSTRRRRTLAVVWALVLAGFFLLMMGGAFGLEEISSDEWGGLPLTVVLTLVGMAGSVPIGVLLAMGRQSEIPLVRILSAGYIELVRGVPLITVLFMATFIFPLLMPSEFNLPAFWRVVVAIALFQAAYIAETVRGGLQTIPKGQMTAGLSLGFSKLEVYRYILLPQAFIAVIPAFVNSLLSCYMDTSLVTIVSMYDLTGSLRLALGDAQWRGSFIEGYIFIAFIYFSTSFAISRYSAWLESKLKVSYSDRQTKH